MNSQPSDYGSDALPVAPRKLVAGMEGLEPSTYGLTDRRYHQLSYIPISKCPDSNRASASLTRRATITPASRQSEWQVAACQWHASSNDRSEAETLNLRPRPPEGRVLPDYTTSRKRPVWGPAPSAFLRDRQAATPCSPTDHRVCSGLRSRTSGLEDRYAAGYTIQTYRATQDRTEIGCV